MDWIFLLLSLAALSFDVSAQVKGGVCQYGGGLVNAGTRFQNIDRPNCQCTCELKNGIYQVICDENSCDPIDPNHCFYNGQSYSVGQYFSAKNNCGTCQCKIGRKVECNIDAWCSLPSPTTLVPSPTTLGPNLGLYCNQKETLGTVRLPGAEWESWDRCKKFTCVNGQVISQDKICKCVHNGTDIAFGQSFNFECNSCLCNENGLITCTKETCKPMGNFISMKGKDIDTDWPVQREFGWALKEPEAVTFMSKFHPKTGQLVVIANSPLVRNVTPEMLYWWFRHFGNLKVRVKNVGNYQDGDIIPAYWLWHPFDHYDHAASEGEETVDRHWNVGGNQRAQAAFNFDKIGRKYLTSYDMNMWYARDKSYGGVGLGFEKNGYGYVYKTRVVWELAEEDGISGTHVHHEITGGTAFNYVTDPKAFNKQLRENNNISEDKYKEWRRHLAIKWGCFENMLPRLYEQRDKIAGKPVWIVDYDAATDDAAKGFPIQTISHKPRLVKERMRQYMLADDARKVLTFTQAIGGRLYPSQQT